ncbi:hypothetical protein SAMN04488109_4009 [Chryseolinea serpens]|uniref:DUF6602 domain-containing protein n=2 Tax=Chryseolinea serpens TaxID=947013 RepID=A0A1M5TDM5_9BACT|nr:hypothetical protein SAMN04488109_4009 [Chryseolinea serpens]
MFENSYGQRGWKEFIRNRKDILSEFDRLKDLTENRPVQTAHGQGVEAYLRKWLGEFLPKKYGVTSGYIIPNVYNDTGKIYHYDVIIYNQLESPVLWTEGNVDQSEQGKARAISAKNVVAVYEVKSRFTKQNVFDAIEKLNQIDEFKDQLAPLYTCGIIFIELVEDDVNRGAILKELIKGAKVAGFNGGVVLRYQGDLSCTGLIHVSTSKENNASNGQVLTPLARAIDTLKIVLTEEGSLQIREQGAGAKLTVTSNNNWSVTKVYMVSYQEGDKIVLLSWSRSAFADFCIELLARLEGIALNDSNRASFGQVFDNIEREQARIQLENKLQGEAHLKIQIVKQVASTELFVIDDEASQVKILIEVENIGSAKAIISVDGFKNRFQLLPNQKATKQIAIGFSKHQTDVGIRDILKESAREVSYRVVYYSAKESSAEGRSEGDFVAIEKKIRITEAGADFVD